MFQLLTSVKYFQKNWGVFLYKADMANCPGEVSLHQCTQHKEQTGLVRNHCGVQKLSPICHHCYLVGRMPCVALECSCQWLQAVHKGQERKEGWRACSQHQEVGWVWRAISEELPWAGWKLEGKNQSLRQQKEPCGQCPLQAAWCRAACGWSLLAQAIGSIVLKDSCPARELQPPWHLLGK